MSLKMNKIFAAVFFVLALALTLTPNVIAPVCKPVPVDGKEVSKCETCGPAMGMDDKDMAKDSNMADKKDMSKEPMKVKPMKCKWFGEAVKATGILMMALAVGLFTLKNADIRKGVVLANILLGLQAIIHIVFIGGCMNAKMPCRAHTIPAVILISGIYTVLSFYYLVRIKKDVVNQDN